LESIANERENSADAPKTDKNNWVNVALCAMDAIYHSGI